MDREIASVFEFMDKHQQPVGALLIARDRLSTECLSQASQVLLAQAHRLTKYAEANQAQGINEVRIERAALLVEEVGELLVALARCDVIDLADAMADTLYVLLGAAIAYSIPLGECFDEVHRSNMTKTPTRSSGDTLLKRKSKGPNFSAAQLVPILVKAGLLKQVDALDEDA